MNQFNSTVERMSLCGRVGLVTGATGGIGRAICTTIAELGGDVAMIDRDQAVLDKFANELATRFGSRVIGWAMDLESENARIQLHSHLTSEFDRLDILVNNAAFVGDSGLTGWAVPFEEQRIDTWRRAVEVNLTACFHLSQLFVPQLRKHSVGSIINMGSIYGLVGPDMSLYSGTKMGNPAAYASSKGGLVQLTRWMATTLGPDIRVNCISPGGVFRGQPDPFVERYSLRTPLKRMATEEDFQGATAYLSSDLSRYVTGHNLVVDGGWTAW